jgi:hypothetical protein
MKGVKKGTVGPVFMYRVTRLKASAIVCRCCHACHLFCVCDSI